MDLNWSDIDLKFNKYIKTITIRDWLGLGQLWTGINVLGKQCEGGKVARVNQPVKNTTTFIKDKTQAQHC